MPPQHPAGCQELYLARPYVGSATLGRMEPPVQNLVLTPKMAAVIKIFLQDTQRPRYGLELMRLTGQPSGTLYPNLAKFEEAGWLVGGKEDIDPHAEGRPARRFY